MKHEHDDGIKRDHRVKDTGEVFTPTELVQKMLDELDIDWKNPPQDKTFLDPTCGNGQFLAELAERGIPPQNIYGVDLMADNIEFTKNRLRKIFKAKGHSEDDIRYHLDRNIVQADALEYDYSFWEKEDSLEVW